MAAELLPLARAAAAGTLDDAGWDALKRGALEMVERQVAHIQKETMALLPMLDDLLDDDDDRELAFALRVRLTPDCRLKGEATMEAVALQRSRFARSKREDLDAVVAIDAGIEGPARRAYFERRLERGAARAKAARTVCGDR